jgi:hypothetical protein
MKVSPFVQRVLIDQGGQVLAWVTLMIFCLLGMTGLTVDVGLDYVVKSQLQGCSQSSALSAAEAVYNTGSTGTASSQANQYSCGSGGLNANATPYAVSTTVATPCLNSLLPTGVTCADMNNAPNAVRVTETAIVPQHFMRVFGKNSVTVSATATAAFGTTQPYNVAFILDSTPSMGSADPNCGGIQAEQCAMNGIQLLLGKLNPCKGGVVGCNPTQATALFRVAIFSFPNISVADTTKDECASGNPNFQPYTFPKPTTGYTEITYKTTGNVSTPITYLITQPTNDGTGDTDQYGFSSDYYLSSETDNLNTSSKVIQIIGHAAGGGCMKEPGNYNAYMNNNAGNNGGSGLTYQAGAIYAAQNALNAEQAQTATLGIKAINVIVFVSDGQANSDSSTFVPTTDTITAGSGYVARSGNGTYPDIKQECQQTIEAAQYANGLGTRVYGVAYGSEATGCTTDSAVVVTNTGSDPVHITGTNQVIPCTIMEDMSSATGASSGLQFYFYGDVTSQANGCLGNTTVGSGVNDIFQGILETLTAPELISNNAT